jgi:uncharacterized membrane protein YgcG
VRRALLCAVLLLASGAAAAAERILDFRSDVRIAADSTLTVTESIVVQAEGRQIRHGIYRDFPTVYTDRLGQRVRVGFDVVSVRLDGGPVSWVTQPLANGVRVRIGDPHALVAQGVHEYALTYRVTREIGFFADHDELYWNVTGNGWAFPIERASADVSLPSPVPADRLTAEAYTGPFGARGRDYRMELRAGGAHYESTRAFAPGEGLTIVLGFPKGVVAPPGARERAAWWLADNRAAVVGLAGALVLFAFLYWRWRRVGRDPRAGPKFPRYEPPPRLGPAAVRFVDRMDYDDRCMAAALLGLGQRGYLKISESGRQYTVERSGKDVEWLPAERRFATMLLAGGRPVTLERKYDPAVQAARDALRADLEIEYGKKLFSRNRGSLTLGVAFAVLTVAAAIALEAQVELLFLLVAVMVAQLALFGYLLPAYSVAGRRVQDHIEGLRYYLGVAEKDDLARLKAPEQTPQEFAKFLPYALALGVEKTWADRFAAVLGVAAVSAAVADYYVSEHGVGGDIGSFAGSLGALGGTVSAASSAPGSASGGGGGGSSGGGGGGGGGGGW